MVGRWAVETRIFRIMRICADDPDEGSQRRFTGGLINGDVTGAIIGAFYDVYNELRFGFLETVYASALEWEFGERGIEYVREHSLEVRYKRRVVGMYRADFLVGGQVVGELKASRHLVDADKRQLLNYLRGTDKEVGLLLHFGPKAEFHRIVHSRVE